MSQSYGQQYFESNADKRIRDTLNRLGFMSGNTIIVPGDGSRISIFRLEKELLPRMREAIGWVVQTRGKVTFQRGPEGGGL